MTTSFCLSTTWLTGEKEPLDCGGQIKMIHGCCACFTMKMYISVPLELFYGTVCIVKL